MTLTQITWIGWRWLYVTSEANSAPQVESSEASRGDVEVMNTKGIETVGIAVEERNAAGVNLRAHSGAYSVSHDSCANSKLSNIQDCIFTNWFRGQRWPLSIPKRNDRYLATELLLDIFPHSFKVIPW